jgi:hypothetical protein
MVLDEIINKKLLLCRSINIFIVAWHCVAPSPSNKKIYIGCSGAYHTIFATGPLINSYATG